MDKKGKKKEKKLDFYDTLELDRSSATNQQIKT